MKTLRVEVVFFLAFFLTWTICAKVFWYSPVNGMLQAWLGQTATDLLLHAVYASVWLGFAASYLLTTGQNAPLSYLKLRRHAARGLVVGAIVGSALFATGLARVWLGGRAPDLDGVTVLSFLSPLVEEVVFRGLVLQRAARHTSFWKANALSAALFVAVHLPGLDLCGCPFSQRPPLLGGLRHAKRPRTSATSCPRGTGSR